MDENWMELLVSLDQNYLPQLRVMLTSLTCNDPAYIAGYGFAQRHPAAQAG